MLRSARLAVLGILAGCVGEGLTVTTGPGSGNTLQATRLDLGTLGGGSSFATDINDQDIVVGWSVLADQSQHAFRWTRAHGMEDLGTLAGHNWSMAVAINPRGDVLGMSALQTEDGNLTGVESVIWRASRTAALPESLGIAGLPGASFHTPVDLNDRQQVLGWSDVDVANAWLFHPTNGLTDITATIPTGFETYPSELSPTGIPIEDAF